MIARTWRGTTTSANAEAYSPSFQDKPWRGI